MYGTDGLTYNAFSEFGPVYLCMIPPILAGAIGAVKEVAGSVKERRIKETALPVCFFASTWITLMLIEGNGFNVSNFIYFSYMVFAVYGIRMIVKQSETAGIIVMVCTGLCFVLFTSFYFRKQNEVYGMNTLFMSTEPGDMIEYSERMYDPKHEKRLYICMDYAEQGGMDLYAGLYGRVPAEVWEPEKTDLGDIYLNLPENYDADEPAVYIVGEEWGGVISALLTDGFYDDTLFGTEHILHK